ncbi:unnamed protein product [Toxocara canis]|uniref:Uncharacterized protein n=1 Tax=Toxocara canis TaxID=6265 RepID=A0A183ULH1_TOXCA|nr:unnamed protein product [Toxocara canis]
MEYRKEDPEFGGSKRTSSFVSLQYFYLLVALIDNSFSWLPYGPHGDRFLPASSPAIFVRKKRFASGTHED